MLQILSSNLITSDAQFGFKKGSSCTKAIYTLRSTAEYFIENNSTVNLCSIDVSKAFDKTNNCVLLLKLLEKNVPQNFILMLYFWFDKIFIMVKWKSTCSYRVKLSAGIRQGGILSPYLFSVFVGRMLIKLKKSKLGCHISGQCLNAIMFADDVLLMSITLRDLQKIINLCFEALKN